MRLFFATIVGCALVGTSAFADDPPKSDAVVSPKADPKVAPNTAAKDDAVVAPKVDAKVAPSNVAKDDAVVAPKVETAAPKEEPVVVPEHPLADTSRATEESKQLRPDDTDAALDKALGLDAQKPEEGAEPEGLGWQMFKTLISLGIVVGLIYVFLNYGLRKMMGLKGAPLGGSSGVVSVLERIPLEQRRTMFVIRAAGEYLLIGTSEGGMTTLAKLDTAEVERIQRERSAEKTQLSPFFQKLLSGQKKSGPPPQA